MSSKGFSARQLVVSGLLTALTVVMGATGIGFIPVPTPAGAATFMHIPVILAGVLEGPLVGAASGLIFGLFTLQFLPDPFVVIPARLFIGVFSFLAFRAFRRPSLGAAAAAVVGTATNTIGTLALAVALGYIPLGGALGIAVVQGIPEAIVAVVILVPVILAVRTALRRQA